MEAKEILNEFVADELLDSSEPVNNDAMLLADGMVDSIGMVHLIGFIEDEFDVEIPPEDLIIENFRTINVIAGYLERRASNQQ